MFVKNLMFKKKKDTNNYSEEKKIMQKKNPFCDEAGEHFGIASINLNYLASRNNLC